ncbi:MAG TPA: hypothetical protein VHG28_03025 [Longimicrobiaceae bacterium]|nr:hypothetical protein [Longimicrobiaceae bacterium]
MDRVDRSDDSRGMQPDVDRESVTPDDPTRTDYSSRQSPDGGTEGFTGGDPVHDREEFGGRPNVTEERTKHAVAPGEDVERESLGDDQDGSNRA